MKLFALFFLFLSICALVILKIAAMPSYYLTPDSHYYLQAATNLLNDFSYQIHFKGQNRYCAIWPIGYPGLIAAGSWLSSLSPYWSAKTVNLLAVGGCFLLVWREFKDRAFLITLALCSPSLLQLYANTWSETAFLFGLVGFVIAVAKPAVAWWVLVLWGSFLFLVRYIGGFVVIELLLLTGYQRFRQQPFRRELYALTSLLVVMLAYFANNYHQTGTFSGGHGYPLEEPLAQRIAVGLQGIAQETLAWFRDWDLKNPSLPPPVRWFILMVSAVQGVVLLLLIYRLIRALKQVGTVKPLHRATAFFLLTGAVYVTVMVVIYLTDVSIEDLRFRRLAPASFLFTTGLLIGLTDDSNRAVLARIKFPLVAFCLLAMLHALPKTYLFLRLF
ncbi:hypothetical protein ACFQ4C_05520 [Larkinella insperata]|uniref:Glycosyltransferase RgtA/B/C/D-like domain-containing protein n=1 Tax=Larkinella insperata TaxID=332158 RepID=A0ABW3Q4Q2_9BACT|nr:hypothetical protein [Larkinella insperata]